MLGFEPVDLFEEEPAPVERSEDHPRRIAIAGTGYVGLSLAVLLAQHNEVTAVDIVKEKTDKLNQFISPIQDSCIEQYLAEAKAGKRVLHLHATTDGASAYRDAEFIIIAAPTNYDPSLNFFDCSAVEDVITLIQNSTRHRKNKPLIVIKSTIPVGYTEQLKQKFQEPNLIFSPEFLRESKALYDNLYPSRIIVGTDMQDERLVEAARTFAGLLQEGAVKENIIVQFVV